MHSSTKGNNGEKSVAFLNKVHMSQLKQPCDDMFVPKMGQRVHMQSKRERSQQDCFKGLKFFFVVAKK